MPESTIGPESIRTITPIREIFPLSLDRVRQLVRVHEITPPGFTGAAPESVSPQNIAREPFPNLHIDLLGRKINVQEYISRRRAWIRADIEKRRQTLLQEGQTEQADALPRVDIEGEQRKDAESTKKLAAIVAELSPANVKVFLSNPDVFEDLDLFLDIDPKKIDLALTVQRQVNEISVSRGFENEYMGALNLGCYVALEFLRDQGLSGLNVAEVRANLESIGKKEGLLWSQQSLIRNLIDIFSSLPTNLRGEKMEKALLEVVATQLHGRLKRHTDEVAFTGQSQGFEVEVLKRVTKSPRAVERGIDTERWLPRGIRKKDLVRKDFNLLVLLGLPEDKGERAHQLYEVSPHPSETAAIQTSIMFELMMGGFLDEKKLREFAGEREGYSLHVSTVFPKSIISPESLREYRDMARALAGAFASDQRISFGGFMSGGEEVTDKSAAGTLKEIGKRKPVRASKPASEDKALIEIRNLDITLKGQYSALLNKEYLDYAFRCSWQVRTEGSVLSELDVFAAQAWDRFTGNLRALFVRYGIDESQLRVKYGDSWEQEAWKEMAAARDRNPRLKAEFAQLIRECTGEIREKKRELEQRRTLLVEPLSGHSDRIYLTEAQRTSLGLNVGDTITIDNGDRQATLQVSQAKIRADGLVEENGAVLRVSPDVVEKLGLPDGYTFNPLYGGKSHQLSIRAIESRDAMGCIRIREPRTVLAEPLGKADDRIYLTAVDRKRFGLESGGRIVIRIGGVKKEIVVAQSKIRSDDSAEVSNSESWRLSQNIIDEIGLPGNVPLRAKYDSERHELTFGPIIAHNTRIEDDGSGDVSLSEGEEFFRAAERQATQMGALLCVVDANQQDPDVLASGYVDAYITVEGTHRLHKVRIPKPDIIYDKDTHEKTDQAREFLDSVPQVLPPGIRRITTDKLQFATLLRDSNLSASHPETVRVTSAADIEGLLVEHESIILKPRFGQESKGIFKIERLRKGRYIVKLYERQGDRWTPVEREVGSIEEALEITKSLRSNSRGRERQYIAQPLLPLVKYKFKSGDLTVTRNVEMRVVLQRGNMGSQHVSGVIARLTPPRLVGGEYQKEPLTVLTAVFPDRYEEIYRQMQQISRDAMQLIENSLGRQIGEVTFDFGITTDGTPIIIEGNSMAMTRNMFTGFSRTDPNRNPDAVYQTTQRPLEYALHLTGMD